MHNEVSEDFLSFFPLGTACGWAHLHHPPQASTEGSRTWSPSARNLWAGDMALLRWGLGRQNVHRSSRVLLLKLTVVIISALLLCEYFIYYLVIFRCRWPEVKTLAHGDSQEPVLKAMFLADTHLLGVIRGHWLDKLRR